MSTTDEKTTEVTEGKKASKDAPPAHLGWNSHEAVVSSTVISFRFITPFT